MEDLLIDVDFPGINLIESIDILGLSPKTLHGKPHSDLFITEKTEASPEVLVQLPPKSEGLTSQDLDMIFTDQIVKLETSNNLPRFFATSLTNEKNNCTYLHCLFVYEPISPSIIDFSKPRVLPSDFFGFVDGEKDLNENQGSFLYAPVVICVKSRHNFIDFFRKTLKALYLHLADLTTDDFFLNSAMKSIEFLKYTSILLNDLIVTPPEILYSLKIGNHSLQLPYESSSNMIHNESAITILIDLIDIGNIIDFWEIMILNKHAFLMSCNEYLLFIIIEGFKSILFPLTWTCNIIPVLSPHLVDVIECPVPILLGLNSTKIPKQTALSSEQDKVILDIDSNIIYLKPVSTLCPCTRNIISKKLQILKTYFYVDPKRLPIFKRKTMENSIDDHEFVKNARKLLKIEDKEEKENLFVDLVKQTFFKIFLEGLSEIELFMIDKGDRNFVFDKKRFIRTQGFCKKCSSNEFWTALVETSNFEQFTAYYGKLDSSFISKFLNIVKGIKKNGQEGYKCVMRPELSLEISPLISPKDMFEVLLLEIKLIETENCEDKYQQKSAIEILEGLKEILNENKEFFESPECENYAYMRRRSFTINNLRELKENDFKVSQNTFYGKFGIIRCLSTIFYFANPESFQRLSEKNPKISEIFKKLSKIDEKINELTAKSSKHCEAVLLKLLYLFKQNEEKVDFTEVFNILSFLNKKCPNLIPTQLMVYTLDKIGKIDPLNLEFIANNSGKLGEIARKINTLKKKMQSGEEDVYSKDDILEKFRSFRTLSENDYNKSAMIRI